MINEAPRSLVVPAFSGRDVEIAIFFDQLDAAERRLGWILPAALNDYYLIAGDHPEMTSKDFHALPPEKLRIEDDYLGVVNGGLASSLGRSELGSSQFVSRFRWLTIFFRHWS